MLANLSTDEIWVSRIAVEELLSLLRNIELNAGDGFKSTRLGSSSEVTSVKWGTVSKIEQFNGKIVKGYFFLQQFKMLILGVKEARKIKSFSALLESDALIWLRFLNNCLWEKLELEFIKVWCIHLLPT